MKGHFQGHRIYHEIKLNFGKAAPTTVKKKCIYIYKMNYSISTPVLSE